jgi:hypothetical protein
MPHCQGVGYNAAYGALKNNATVPAAYATAAAAAVAAAGVPRPGNVTGVTKLDETDRQT